MTAPSYTSDVTSNELTLAEATTGFYKYGTGNVADETDYAIQGSHCVSKPGWVAATRGIAYDAGSDKAAQFTGYKALLIWVEYHNPNLLDTYANGGIQLIIGQDNTAADPVNFYGWSVGGSNTIPYGGWHCFAVDPTVDTNGDITYGSPSNPLTIKRFFGAVCKVLGSGTLKGNPIGVDAIRIGRELYAEYGEAANYSTLAGCESYANDPSRRWGLLYLREGAYYQQGCLVMGTAAHAVDWRDSDRSILILDTPKVHASFNGFEVRNASSRVDWTRYTLKALGTTSKGYFTVVDNADVNFDSCTFIDMGAFTLLANTTFLDCNLLRCGQVTAPGSNLTGTAITEPTVAADAGAVVWNVATNPDGYLDDMTFTKGANAHHAIAFGTSAPTSITLRGVTFVGFNASDAANDSVLLIPDKGSDTTWTINCIGTSGTVSYKKARSGDTVNIVLNPVTLGVNVVDLVTGNPINGARVYVFAAAGGDMTEGDVIINDVTVSGGRLTDSRTYTSDQPIDGWVRYAPTAGPHYKEGPVGGTVDSEGGLEVTVQMVADE